jgi:hypothetical protein
MLSEAGAVACCGWLAACVYKILSWLRALFAEVALGVGAASTDSSQVDWVVVAVVVGANIWVVVFSGNHRMAGLGNNPVQVFATYPGSSFNTALQLVLRPHFLVHLV